MSHQAVLMAWNMLFWTKIAQKSQIESLKMSGNTLWTKMAAPMMSETLSGEHIVLPDSVCFSIWLFLVVFDQNHVFRDINRSQCNTLWVWWTWSLIKIAAFATSFVHYALGLIATSLRTSFVLLLGLWSAGPFWSVFYYYYCELFLSIFGRD